jgi:hypothetical protein
MRKRNPDRSGHAGANVCASLGATPDTETFTSKYTSAALDGAAAIASTLTCVGDDSVVSALRVAQAGYDTVETFGRDEGEALGVNALRERELTLQRESLIELAGMADLSNAGLERFRFKYSRRILDPV